MPSGIEQAALWTYLGLMAAGAMLFFAWSRDPKDVPGYEYAVAIFSLSGQGSPISHC